MVSWDMEVKFLGLSPNIKELVKLAKREKFSNIESIKLKKYFPNCNSIYRLIVNDRGLKQKKFKYEKMS